MVVGMPQLQFGADPAAGLAPAGGDGLAAAAQLPPQQLLQQPLPQPAPQQQQQQQPLLQQQQLLQQPLPQQEQQVLMDPGPQGFMGGGLLGVQHDDLADVRDQVSFRPNVTWEEFLASLPET